MLLPVYLMAAAVFCALHTRIGQETRSDGYAGFFLVLSIGLAVASAIAAIAEAI